MVASPAGLPGSRRVRGNADHAVIRGDRLGEDGALALPHPERPEASLWTARPVVLAQAALTGTSRLEWLAALPDEQRLVLPDGTRVPGVRVARGWDAAAIAQALARPATLRRQIALAPDTSHTVPLEAAALVALWIRSRASHTP